MKRMIILVNIVLVSIALVLWNEKRILPESRKDKAKEIINLNVIFEDDADDGVLDEIKEGVSLFPVDVIERFGEERWSIKILNLEDGQGEDSIDFTEREIVLNSPNDVKEGLVYEMACFMDYSRDYMSKGTVITEIYERYRDSYISADGSEIKGGSCQEFFALIVRDYMLHKEYLLKNYPEIYEKLVVDIK